MQNNSGTTDKDMGAKAIQKLIESAKNSWVDVGYWGAKKHTDGDETIPAIAANNEFGTGRIPERSFVRSTADANRARYQRLLMKGAESIIDRKATVQGVLAATGELILSDIRAKLMKSDPAWPALAESTIKARKHGGTQPLFDTGALAASGGTRVIINGQQVQERGAN